MARNGLKIANSLDCAFRFKSEFRYWGPPLPGIAKKMNALSSGSGPHGTSNFDRQSLIHSDLNYAINLHHDFAFLLYLLLPKRYVFFTGYRSPMKPQIPKFRAWADNLGRWCLGVCIFSRFISTHFGYCKNWRFSHLVSLVRYLMNEIMRIDSFLEYIVLFRRIYGYDVKT